MHILKIPAADKARLRVMFLAKHALGTGALDREDGNHAVYHHEMRETLKEIGLDVVPANSFAAIYDKPDVDYVFTLLNRGGFVNSEMLASLLLTRHGVPYLGATPILRGLGDDKHLMKLAAVYRGVPVTPWVCIRRGQELPEQPDFPCDRLVIKPNASSASWGVAILEGWEPARAHAASLLAQGHDVIIEPWVPAGDAVLSVIGADGPLILPAMRFILPDREDNFRSYEEKRALVGASTEKLVPITDPKVTGRLEAYTRALLPEVWPFDYGRFEFRYDPATDELRFMEVNLSCNLWSKKTVSGAAQLAGMTHAQLVETIVADSMRRQGVIERTEKVAL